VQSSIMLMWLNVDVKSFSAIGTHLVSSCSSGTWKELPLHMVFVSAGFDIGVGEVVGTEEGKYDNMLVRSSGFALMTNLLLTHMKKILNHGRLVVSLEGGYNVSNVADGVEAIMRVMIGQPHTVRVAEPYTLRQEEDMKTSRIQFDQDLLDVLEQQEKFWPCLSTALRAAATRTSSHIRQQLNKSQRILHKRKKAADSAELAAVKAEEITNAKRRCAEKFHDARRKAEGSVNRWQALLSLSNELTGSVEAEVCAEVDAEMEAEEAAAGAKASGAHASAFAKLSL
jgi:hypothetical protein